MVSCARRLTFCAGHRVYGHESKCANLHGHNYAAIVECAAERDSIGRVIDFSVIKAQVGGFLEAEWDHAFLYFQQDHELVVLFEGHPEWKSFCCPFNPTAENMAEYLFYIAELRLGAYGIRVVRVRVEETENCRADFLPR